MVGPSDTLASRTRGTRAEIKANGPCKSNINVNSLRNNADSPPSPHFTPHQIFLKISQESRAGTRGTVLREHSYLITRQPHTPPHLLNCAVHSRGHVPPHVPRKPWVICSLCCESGSLKKVPRAQRAYALPLPRLASLRVHGVVLEQPSPKRGHLRRRRNRRVSNRVALRAHRPPSPPLCMARQHTFACSTGCCEKECAVQVSKTKRAAFSPAPGSLPVLAESRSSSASARFPAAASCIAIMALATPC